MRYKNKILSLAAATLLTFNFSLSTISAQESINTTGGIASGSGGTVSYSVGQIVYQTQTGTTGSVSEGVQQPYEISVVTAIEEALGINLTVTAYPNPTTESLTLEIKDFQLSTFHFQLLGMNGQLLQSQVITVKQTSIDMSHHVSGTYFVKVIQGKKEVKTFKIIKTQ